MHDPECLRRAAQEVIAEQYHLGGWEVTTEEGHRHGSGHVGGSHAGEGQAVELADIESHLGLATGAHGEGVDAPPLGVRAARPGIGSPPEGEPLESAQDVGEEGIGAVQARLGRSGETPAAPAHPGQRHGIDGCGGKRGADERARGQLQGDREGNAIPRGGRRAAACLPGSGRVAGLSGGDGRRRLRGHVCRRHRRLGRLGCRRRFPGGWWRSQDRWLGGGRRHQRALQLLDGGGHRLLDRLGQGLIERRCALTGLGQIGEALLDAAGHVGTNLLGELLAQLLEPSGLLAQPGGLGLHVGQSLPDGLVVLAGAGDAIDPFLDVRGHLGTKLVGDGLLETLQPQRLVPKL